MYNKLPYGPQQEMLVGTVTTVPTGGTLNTTGNNFNIANAQFGVVSADLGGTPASGTFLASAGATYANVNAVRVIQGTPNSADASVVSPFGYNDPAFVDSGVINGANIVSVSTKVATLPKYQLNLATGFTAPVAGSEYQYGVIIESEEQDALIGREKRRRVQGSVKIPATGVTNTTHYFLTKLAYDINTNSQLVNPGGFPFVALALDTGGAGGTDIGTLTKDSSITFMAHKGVDLSMTAGIPLINALYGFFNDSTYGNASLSTAEVVKIDTATALTGATIDAILLVSLDEPTAAALDETANKKARCTLYTDEDLTFSNNQKIGPEADGSLGSKWITYYRSAVAPTKYSGQRYGFGEMDLTPDTMPQYISASTRYTSTTITYYDVEHTQTTFKKHPKMLTILLPAAIADDAVDADTGYTVATNSTLKTAMNNQLGAWLSSSATANGVTKFLEDASASTPFGA